MGRDWSEEPIRVKKKMAGLGDLLDVGMDTEEKRKYHVCEPIYLSIYLFIYLWLCWVFVSVRGLSLIAASGGHSSSRCAGLSLSRPLVVEHSLQTHGLSSCSARA